ncbi:thioredoxin family protein [Haloferacaceae archaeon DSL9]
MGDADDIEAIRQQKRAKLEAQLRGGTFGADEAASESPATPSEPIAIASEDHFGEVTGRYDVVLVDFHAEWCGPCKMLEPTITALADDPDVAVAKVDIDAQRQLAARYGVQGVPNVVLFANGSPVERVVGVEPKETYESLIRQHA